MYPTDPVLIHRLVFIIFFNSMSNVSYEKISTAEKLEDSDCNHPTTSANVLSLLTFWWVNSIFKAGSERPLDQSDYLPLHEEDRTRDVTEQLQKEWNNHVQDCNMTEGKQPKLWKSVLRVIPGVEIVFWMCFFLVESICRVAQPLVLGLLLQSLGSAERNRSQEYVYCFLLSLSGLSTAFTHYSAYRLELLGMRLSSAIKGIVYLKVRIC